MTVVAAVCHLQVDILFTLTWAGLDGYHVTSITHARQIIRHVLSDATHQGQGSSLWSDWQLDQ